jgi:4-hydroxybenzoate polyprenyltransferase
VFNDIFDAKKDAAHPVKCKRPIANGLIAKPKAAVFCVALALSGIAISLTVNGYAALLVLAYLLLNISYTVVLKHKPIFDCFCIAAGFVLRIYSGGVASGDTVSDWLFLTIVTASLFMALGKRRGEMLKTDDNTTREVLSRYNIDYLHQMMFVCAGLAVTFYSLWSMSRRMNMIYTVPMIIFIVCKYLLLLYDNGTYGDPTTVIYSNKVLLASIILYAAVALGLLYMGTAQ